MRCKLCTLNFRGTAHPCACDAAGGRQTRLAVEAECITRALQIDTDGEPSGVEGSLTAGCGDPPRRRGFMLGDYTRRPPTVPLHRMGGKALHARDVNGKVAVCPVAGGTLACVVRRAWRRPQASDIWLRSWFTINTVKVDERR